MTWEMSLCSIVFLERLKLQEMSFTSSRMKLEQDRFDPTENSIDWHLLQCTGYLFPQAQREVEGLGVKNRRKMQLTYRTCTCIICIFIYIYNMYAVYIYIYHIVLFHDL